MVVEKKTSGDVDGDKDIDRIVFVCSEDEKDTESIEQPGEIVQSAKALWGILSDEKVQKSDHSGVTTEHVVSAGPHSLQRHPYNINQRTST